MLKYILILVLFLCSCSMNRERLVPVFEQRQNLNVPELNEMNLKKVEFIVITPENIQEVFQKLESEKIELVIFGLTGLNYKNLALNVNEIQNYIQLQNFIIEQYKKYYENENN